MIAANQCVVVAHPESQSGVAARHRIVEMIAADGAQGKQVATEIVLVSKAPDVGGQIEQPELWSLAFHLRNSAL